MPDRAGRLYPREAAVELKVDVKTLHRWAQAGLIGYELSMPGKGGHRRYPPAEVERVKQLLADNALVLAGTEDNQ